MTYEVHELIVPRSVPTPSDRDCVWFEVSKTDNGYLATNRSFCIRVQAPTLEQLKADCRKAVEDTFKAVDEDPDLPGRPTGSPHFQVL